MTIRKMIPLCLAFFAAMLMVCADAQAQPGGGRGGRFGGFGGGRGFGGFGGGPLALVQREDVQQELSLTRSQVDQVESLVEEAREQRSEGFGEFGDFREMSQEERREAFARVQEQRREHQSEMRAKLKDVLNTAQAKRLTELEVQFALERGDVRGVLDAMGVDLSGADREKLEATQDRVNDRVREQIAKIQREAQMEVLASVVDSGKLQSAMGEEFEFERAGPRFGRGGRGGDPGDRGGRGFRRRGSSSDDDDAPTGGRRRRRGG